MRNKWNHYHAYDEYYDFVKSVQNFEDFNDTRIEVTITFNYLERTAHYIISTDSDAQIRQAWEKCHPIPWDDAINTIYRDGCDNFPEELKEKE